MPRQKEQFQTFSKAKTRVTTEAENGKIFVDYKNTESLKKLLSGNGKISSRKRSGASAMEQRMIAKAIKRARYMALLPYVATVS